MSSNTTHSFVTPTTSPLRLYTMPTSSSGKTSQEAILRTCHASIAAHLHYLKTLVSLPGNSRLSRDSNSLTSRIIEFYATTLDLPLHSDSDSSSSLPRPPLASYHSGTSLAHSSRQSIIASLTGLLPSGNTPLTPQYSSNGNFPMTALSHSETYPICSSEALAVRDDLLRANAAPAEVMDSMATWLKATAEGLLGTGRDSEAAGAVGLAVEVMEWRDEVNDAEETARREEAETQRLRDNMRSMCLRWGA